jgi:hypothetical protein
MTRRIDVMLAVSKPLISKNSAAARAGSFVQSGCDESSVSDVSGIRLYERRVGNEEDIGYLGKDDMNNGHGLMRPSLSCLLS